MDKKKLSETDIITKFIMPAVQGSGWNLKTQINQEVKLRDGKVIVRDQLESCIELSDFSTPEQLKVRLNDTQTIPLYLADAVLEQALS